MSAFRVWSPLWVLVFMDVSLCLCECEYDDNYTDDHANEISQNRHEEEFQPTPCQNARWDKIFIALENSQMRQNMLLGSLEQCNGEMASLKTQVSKLAEEMCLQCVPTLEAVCQRQAEQASLKLQQGLTELREEGAERERRLNSTLHQLLHSGREQDAQLKLKEEGSGATPLGEKTQETADIRTTHQSTLRRRFLGTAIGLGMKPFPSGMNGPEVTSSPDMASIERALITIATELQKVQLQLNRLLEQIG